MTRPGVGLIHGITSFWCCFYVIRAYNASVSPEQALLKRITEQYDTKLRPNFNGPAVKITASTYIVAVDNVNDVTTDFTVKMYFRQNWNDSRLAYTGKIGENHMKTIRVIGEFVDDIWTPDTYVENEENIGSYKVFSSVKVSDTGTVEMSQRLTIKANCPTMNLRMFPHDVQTCNLLQTSYAYPSGEVTYEWLSQDAVVVAESPIASQYYLQETITATEERYFKGANATWSYLKLTFILKRRIAYYIIRIYLPAILVTFTSWVSFWVDPQAIPARLSLCVITVLSMTTLTYNSQSMVPSVPYVKAVDWYLIMSFVFVFAVLLEYAILLNVTLRRNRSKQAKKQKVKKEEIPFTRKQKSSGIVTEDVENGLNGEESVDVINHEASRVFTSWTLDNFSTMLFPLAYVFFHVVYFTALLA